MIGAWLDVLVRWLSDLREGRCAYGFFYNQVACCSGLDCAYDMSEYSYITDFQRQPERFAGNGRHGANTSMCLLF